MARKDVPRSRWMEKQKELWWLAIDLLRLVKAGLAPKSLEFNRAVTTQLHFKSRIDEMEAAGG
jgi:hypothetical protein